ncbi:MAG: hypothetical protein WCQ72_05870, partial [Eubacteriales bacterium]
HRKIRNKNSDIWFLFRDFSFYEQDLGLVRKIAADGQILSSILKSLCYTEKSEIKTQIYGFIS